MVTRQQLGIGGSLILFVGVFAPLISLPIVGTMNYFQNGRGDGTIILILAAVSLALTITERYKGLWITGIASLALLGFTYMNFQNRLGLARAQMEQELAGNPFAGLAQIAMESVQLQWGWALLIIGSLAILSAAAMKPQAGVETKNSAAD